MSKSIEDTFKYNITKSKAGGDWWTVKLNTISTRRKRKIDKIKSIIKNK